jgi:hypothetical protein
MRKRLVLLSLIAMMLLSVVGLGMHQHEGLCPLTNLPDCCKTAQSTDNAPQVSMARLCCNLNCSEPGNSGSNISSTFPTPQNLPAHNPVIPDFPQHGIGLPSGPQSARLLDGNPKYIQHLALLI